MRLRGLLIVCFFDETELSLISGRLETERIGSSYKDFGIAL
jgi:hypothetical protein